MNKIIKIFLLSIIAIPLLAQKYEFEPPLLYEYYFSQPDSGNGLFQFVYRINYDKLFFTKDGESYTSNIRVTLELQDSSSGAISRTNDDKRISVSTFDETLDKNKSVQGLLNIKLEKRKYFGELTLTDISANKDFAFPKISINLTDESPKNYIVYSADGEKYYLANRRKTIPFSHTTFSLIYASVKNEQKNDSLCLKFNSPTDSLTFCSYTTLNDNYILKEDSIGIYLSSVSTSSGNSYLFKDISLKLPEGKFSVQGSGKDKTIFEVKWWDKPHSLLNYDISLKAFSIIESKTLVDSLKELGNNLGYSAFNKYWKKYDPSPNTTYNDLMGEYYTRVDYAQKTFSNFATPDGIMSDRGQIYIKYGPPLRVERSSGANGKNLEIWFYKGRNKPYYFRDNLGNGSYQLVKEK
ncbi:MAG: GWxTD domain-containing protein [Ignavibacteriaceae bacterium]|jgi:GWxTD domain-containing protein